MVATQMFKIVYIVKSRANRSIIQPLGRLRHVNCKLKAILGNLMRPCKIIWGYGSMVELLCSIHKVLGSMLCTNF